jgi:hypothetical protein
MLYESLFYGSPTAYEEIMMNAYWRYAYLATAMWCEVKIRYVARTTEMVRRHFSIDVFSIFRSWQGSTPCIKIGSVREPRVSHIRMPDARPWISGIEIGTRRSDRNLFRVNCPTIALCTTSLSYRLRSEIFCTICNLHYDVRSKPYQ